MAQTKLMENQGLTDWLPVRFRLSVTNFQNSAATPKPVLIEFADQLVSRLSPGGILILSGLIDKDVSEVSSVYSSRLGGRLPAIEVQGEWRALWWGPLD